MAEHLLVQARRENEDLRMSLQLNKESLQVMLSELHQRESKEKSLIETINIISQDNANLNAKLGVLYARLERPQTADQSIQTVKYLCDQSTDTADLMESKETSTQTSVCVLEQ